MKRRDACGATAWRGRSTDDSTDESTTDEFHCTQVPAPPRGHAHVVAYLPHQCLQSRRNPIRNPISDGAEKRQLHRSCARTRTHTHTHAHAHRQTHTHARAHTHRQRVRRESSCRGNLHDEPAAATPLGSASRQRSHSYRQRKTSTGGGRQHPPARSSCTKPTPSHEPSARALSPALCWTSLMLRRSRHAGCRCCRCCCCCCCCCPRPRPRPRPRPSTKNG